MCVQICSEREHVFSLFTISFPELAWKDTSASAFHIETEINATEDNCVMYKFSLKSLQGNVASSVTHYLLIILSSTGNYGSIASLLLPFKQRMQAPFSRIFSFLRSSLCVSQQSAAN